jgi:ABC-2 type transport system ATP-binding protein
LSDIERVCDTIAVIHEGHLILVSDKEQLLEKYAVNAAFLEIESNSLPISQVFLDDLEKRDWVSRLTVAGNTIRILASDVPQAKNELLPLIVKHGIVVNRYEWIRPSLEEIFMQISR